MAKTRPPSPRRSPTLAALWGAPIGLLGGLIGLGGAEFRLPVLAGVFGYAARRAIALNLAISLVTVVSALLIRGGTLSLAPLLELLPVVGAMIAGAVSAAYLGTALVHRVSEQLLERVILVFLVGIGSALIVEAFLPQDVPGLLPDLPPVRLAAAVLFGLAVGLVSSLLGVAGGELIIPTLVFAFGVDIKTAGTASLLISLPTVAVGVMRHGRLGAFEDRADIAETVAPMGAGSVVGAVAGRLLRTVARTPSRNALLTGRTSTARSAEARRSRPGDGRRSRYRGSWFSERCIGRCYASRSAIKHGPAHLIAQPLVVQHEFSDLAGKPCPLPLAL